MTDNYNKKRDIAYEPSDKRRFYRLTNPVRVRINGKKFITANWSVNAFKINDYTGDLTRSKETIAEFEINFQGFVVKFEQKIKVLRVERENNMLVAEYVDVSPRNREILSYFSKGLITGEFQPFDEVIRHIDIPITDEYVDKTFREGEEKKSFSRDLSILIYILVGIAVLMYIFNLYHSNVNLLRVDSAVVSGKTELITSPARGILSKIFVQEGKIAEKGKPLFKIDDVKTQREIEEKKNEILKNRALLKEKQNQLIALQSRLENYKKDFSFKLNVQEKIIDSIGKRLDLLNNEMEKKTRLYERKLISRPEIDALQTEIIEQEKELAAANYEYYHIYQNIRDPESGTNSEIHKREDSKSLKAEIEKIKEIININKKELAYVEALNEQNTVKAPFKSYLAEVLAFEGKYVDERTPVLFLKDVTGEKFIEAYLTEEEALKLKLGFPVEINIPSQDINTKGKLVKLEKRQEFLGKNFIVAIIEPEISEILNSISDGTPASVIFIKNKIKKPGYLFHG